MLLEHVNLFSNVPNANLYPFLFISIPMGNSPVPYTTKNRKKRSVSAIEFYFATLGLPDSIFTNHTPKHVRAGKNQTRTTQYANGAIQHSITPHQ